MMSDRSPGHPRREPPANPNLAHGKAASALGLAWVYSGALWLLLLALLAQGGYFLAAGGVCLRLVATLAVGVGLCGTERWAWAMAVCMAAFYLALGLAVGTGAAQALVLLPPGTLSWKPVFLGLNTDDTVRLLVGAGLAALVSGTNLALLWRTQAHFDIPHRRSFTVLLRDGLWPALLVILVDLYLFFGWGRTGF